MWYQQQRLLAAHACTPGESGRVGECVYWSHTHMSSVLRAVHAVRAVQAQYLSQASSYVTKADTVLDSLKGKMGGKFDGIINTADGLIDHAAGFLGVEVSPATGTTTATTDPEATAATTATAADPEATGTTPTY